MKSKIGILALGQCGGNIGSIFEANGYNCLFINTSQEDLSTLSVKYRYKIPDAEGCHHDRNKAIDYAKRYYREIIDQINDKLYYQSLIYFVFSTSGGTGSGLAPILIEMCNATFPDKHFGCIAVLPSDDESPQAQLNAHDCYKAISQIDKLASVFTLDNNKQKDKFKINHIFFSKFNQMMEIPRYTNTKGNIDKAELFKMLTTRGNAYISICNYTPVDDLAPSIIRSWEESDCFANLENDKFVKYMGLSTMVDPNIEALQRYIGTPFDIFKNYNPNSNIVLLTGLNFPKKRIEHIVERLRNKKDVIRNGLSNSLNTIDTELDFLEDIKPPLQIDTKPLEDILKKYAG